MRTNTVSLAIVLAAFSATGHAEESVNISNWNGYIADDTLTSFTKETGVKATYDIHDSNEVLESKNAYAYMNYLLTAKVIANISNSIHYANPNSAADALVIPSVKQDPAIYPPKDVVDKLFTVEDLPPAIARLSIRLWTKLKSNT